MLTQGEVVTRSSAGRGGARAYVRIGTFLVILVWLAVGALGGMAQGRLSEVQQNDTSAFLPASAESTRAASYLAAFRDSSALPALIVIEPVEPGARLSEAQLGAIGAFAASVPDLAVGETGGTIAGLLTEPVVFFPSADGLAALVPVSLEADLVSESTDDGEGRLLNVVVGELREAGAELLEPAGLRVWVAGPAGSVADLVEAFGGIDGLLLLVAVAVVLGILILVYRSPSLPVTVILTAVFALSAASLVVFEMAERGTIDLNGQSQGILFILVVGAATDYALLLVARYREELTRIESPYAAMRVAWRAVLEPISASAGTVVAGLLCLLLSDLSSNASLGPVAAIGIVAAYVAALTLLPALLLVAGRRSRLIFWPRVPRLTADSHRGDAVEASGGPWERLAGWVGRRDRAVWVGTALALVALAAFVPSFRATGTSDSDVFLTDVESVEGGEVLAAHFSAGLAQPVVVVTPEADSAAVLAAVRTLDGVTTAEVVTSGGPEAPALVVDGRVLVNVVTEAASDDPEAQQTVREIRGALAEVSPDALVGGEAAQRLDAEETSERDFRTIAPAVLGVILVVLILLLRSLVAPVLLLAANVLSFGAAIGLSAVVFNHVFGFPGADPSIILYAFVFLVALGIDYTIFLMTRVREESLALGTRPGTRRGLAVTGGVITSAGVVLAATFGALAVIPLLFLVQIAFVVALGVLLDTLVVRSLLVPGLVHDLGRRTWWPMQKKIPVDEA